MPDRLLVNVFLENSDQLFWMIDSNFCLVYANQAFQNATKQITGKKNKIGESVFTKDISDGDIEKWKAYYKRGLNGDHFEVVEHFYNPETKETQYIQVTFKPAVHKDQAIDTVACQSLDITKAVKSNDEAEKLLDASLDVICSIDEQGNFTKVSAACKELWGFEKHELVGQPYIDFVVEEDIEKTNQAASEIIDGILTTTFENRYRRKDGKIAFNLWSARYDAKTKIMFCVARDASEKIKREELLIESDQRFKALVQEGADMISIIDVEGNYMYTSPTTTEILGITPEEFDGNSVFDFIHPEDIERAAEYMQRINTENKVVVEPFRLRDGNKEWRWIETVLTNMLDNPSIGGIVANSRDVTDKKKETQHLKLLESVITNTNDAILITEAEPLDEPGPRILYVNEAFTRMTGYTAEEVIGKTPRILQGPKSDQAELARLSKALRNWEPCEITTVNYKKNGEEFWINFSITPVADEKGWYTHWIAVERDVTEKKNLEIVTDLTGAISNIFNEEVDLNGALHKLCEEVAVKGFFSFCEIWLTNSQESLLELKAVHKSNETGVAFYENSEPTAFFEKGQGVPGVVWENNDAVIWEQEGENHELLFRSTAAEVAGIKTVVGFPLIFHNKFIGVLQFGTQSSLKTIKWITNVFSEFSVFIGSEIARKKTEIELAKIFEFAPDMIATCGFDGFLKTVNPYTMELLGYTEKELTSRPLTDFLHPDDAQITADKLEKLTSGIPIYNFKNRYITKSGDIRSISWNCSPEVEDGLVFCIGKDITEEVKIANLLNDANQISRIGGWEIDMVNQEVHWSDTIYEIHETPENYEPNIVETINFYHEDFRELVTDVVNDCIEAGTPFDIEAKIVTSKNNEVWVRSIGKGEMVNGKCIRIYGSFQDINDQKESELRLQSLTDNLPGVVFQYYLYADGTDALKLVTKGAKEIWGFTAEEVMQNIQLVWNQIAAGGQMEQVQKSITSSVESRKNWTARWKYILPNGEERTHLGIGTPHFLTDGSIMYHSVILDVSQEEKKEELLNEVSKIAKIGTWETDLINGNHYKSPMIDQILELEPQSPFPDKEDALDFLRIDYREKLRVLFKESITLGKPLDFEAVIITAKKKEKWVRIIGSPKIHEGNCVKIIGSLQDINSLKETETRLQTISNNLPGVVYQYVMYPDGTDQLRYVSGAVEKLWGFTSEQVLENINLVWDQIKAGGRMEEVQTSIAKSIETKSKWTNTVKYMKPNGELRTHLGNGIPSFLADGTVVFNSILLDVTQEAKNEQVLEQTATLAGIGSWEMNIVNQNKEDMYWSPMIYKILELDSSYNPSYSGGLELIVDDSKALIKQAMDALMNEGKEFDEEVQMQTGKGYAKWVRIIGKCEWVNNEIVKIYGSLQDINQKKAAEIRMKSLSDNLPGTMFQYQLFPDGTDELLNLSKGAEKLWGISVQEGVKNNALIWDQIIAGGDIEKVQESIEESMNSLENWHVQFRSKLPNGKIKWLEGQGTPRRLPDGSTVWDSIILDITQLKETEQLLASASRLARVGSWEMYLQDNDEFKIFWDHVVKDILEIDQSFEPTLADGISVYKEPSRSVMDAAVNKLMETGEAFDLELELLTGKGNDVWIRCIGDAQFENGKVTRIYGSFQDINTRKLAELNQLKLNEEKSKILERIGDAFYAVDKNWLVTYWNQRAESVLGKMKNEIIGKNLWNEFEGAIGTDFYTKYHYAMEKMETQSFEAFYETTNQWIEVTAYPSEDGLSVYFRDITAKKEFAFQIQEANERFEKAAEATADAIWDWDILNDKFYRGNGFKDLFGYEIDRSLNQLKFDGDNFDKRDYKEIKKSLKMALLNPKIMHWEYQYRIQHATGIFKTVLDKAKIIRATDGKAIRMIGAVKDITYLIDHEKELMELNEVLQSKLTELEIAYQELEQFAYIASHDLQEPLRMVTSFMDQLKRKYGGQMDDKAHQYIDFAIDGAKRMKKIILDILEYSRAGELQGETERLDLNHIIEDYKILRRKIIAEKKVVLEVGDLPIITTYPTPLTQVLHNLIDNAIKYSKDDQPPLVKITGRSRKKFWEFCIEDNGIGMDDKYFDKIFVIFQRLHDRDQYGGTGIGLSVVKKIIESLGGNIWVESSLNAGSKFYFTIPK